MMHICSYIVYVSNEAGALSSVLNELNRLPGCEATPDQEGKGIIILVTETADEAASAQLLKKVESVSSVECIALVFGGTDQIGVAS
jgi:nitrate reductase NapAB chaperone NapD